MIGSVPAFSSDDAGNAFVCTGRDGFLLVSDSAVGSDSCGAG